MENSDVTNGSKTLNDVLNRRLKNRERQRRYRERKRLQAGGRNGHVTDRSSQMQIVTVPTSGTAEQVVTRVHCRRDWKKDARRVHAAIPESMSNGPLSSGQSLASENNMPYTPPGMRESEQAVKAKILQKAIPVYMIVIKLEVDLEEEIGKQRQEIRNRFIAEISPFCSAAW